MGKKYQKYNSQIFICLSLKIHVQRTCVLTFDSTGSNSPWYLIRNGAIKNYNGRKSIDKTQKENAIILWICTWINNGIGYEILFIDDKFYHFFTITV